MPGVPAAAAGERRPASGAVVRDQAVVMDEFHYYGDRELKSAFYDDDDMIFVNASVAWMAERDTVRLSCTNIFDEEYVLDTQGYLAPERRFTISWEHTF